MMQPGDYGAVVDIKDYCLEFGLHPAHRRCCRFRDPRLRRWQWHTTSFGVSEAPHSRARILRPFTGILKGLGVRCSTCLDDLLVLSQSPSSLAVAMGAAIELLQGELGLQLKLSKFNFTPSRLFIALGVIWDTHRVQCLVPKKRISNARSTATRILNAAGAGARSGTFDHGRSNPVRTRDLARLVGQCVSTSIAIRPAKRRLLFLQQLLGKAGHLRCGNTQRRLGGDTAIGRPHVDDAGFLHKRRKTTVCQQPGVIREPQDSRKSAPLGRASVAVASSERCQRHPFTMGDDASRVAASPSVVSGGVSPVVPATRSGLIRQQAKSAAPPVQERTPFMRSGKNWGQCMHAPPRC
jgi:hypothetical protein